MLVKNLGLLLVFKQKLHYAILQHFLDFKGTRHPCLLFGKVLLGCVKFSFYIGLIFFVSWSPLCAVLTHTLFPWLSVCLAVPVWVLAQLKYFGSWTLLHHFPVDDLLTPGTEFSLVGCPPSGYSFFYSTHHWSLAQAWENVAVYLEGVCS